LILKSITLENIRSYRAPTKVDFQMGTTLFEGDVASGKSTILSAIEFALFGLGDLSGSFLLRNGEPAGSVSLTFEVDGREHTVHRSLSRRGDTVRSGEAYIEEMGERQKLATGELKEKVLQLLRFNEPVNPKAQSVIYRFAIFTPQEAMRDIIDRDSGTRLETLRRAYGIEQYKMASQNSKTVSNEFRVKIAGLTGRLRDLDRDRSDLANLRSRIERLKVELSDLRRRKDTLARELEEKRTALKELEERKEDIGRAQERVPLISRQLREKEEQRKAAVKDTEAVKKRISGISKEVARLEAIASPTESSESELDAMANKMDLEITDGRDKVSKLSERLGNFDEILKKGVCPICERPYEAERVSERKSHLEEEISFLDRRLTQLATEKESLEHTQERLADYLQAQKELKPLREGLSEWSDRARLEAERLPVLDKEIIELNREFRDANKAMEPLQKILGEIERSEHEIRATEKKFSSEVAAVGGIEKELQTSEYETQRLSSLVTEKEGLLKLQGKLEEDRAWLSDYFAPTIELIEEQTFANRNLRFNEQFQRWFQILVDDPDLKVRVKEDFAPVIEREGYEQDYGQLSGGERTSVALAYRLALNTTVQETALGQEPNLLILDEPTDGFSKEQLGKFGDILTELNCPQVILVSHERELENLADRVIRIEKVNGESQALLVETYQKRL
jgi:DNA repair protein SbcC/Rad50